MEVLVVVLMACVGACVCVLRGVRFGVFWCVLCSLSGCVLSCASLFVLFDSWLDV